MTDHIITSQEDGYYRCAPDDGAYPQVRNFHSQRYTMGTMQRSLRRHGDTSTGEGGTGGESHDKFLRWRRIDPSASDSLSVASNDENGQCLPIRSARWRNRLHDTGPTPKLCETGLESVFFHEPALSGFILAILVCFHSSSIREREEDKIGHHWCLRGTVLQSCF